MSKIICDICGTSYPETATQCPICGCVRPAEAPAVEESDGKAGGYTYVKGGRFSKSNVRKHNQGVALKYKTAEELENEPANKRNLILVIVLVCLIVVVGLFFGLILLLGSGLGNDGDSNVVTVAPVDDSVTTAPQPTETEPVATTQPATEPEETEPEEKPYVILDRTYIDDANSDVYTWPLYVEGSMPATEIDWISEDTSVATVDAEGRVYAVGEGTTVIRAEYQGEVLATCTIECNFDTEIDDSQEGGDAANGEFGGNYVLYTTYKTQLPYEADKNAYTVTMDHTKSEWMEVYLINKDNSEDKVMLVWEIVEGDCKLDPDRAGFTATTAANCKLKTVYNGQTYYLIIY